MLVSVVIPIYNSERYLAETLTSILASDYANFEVICMDDGSKDASISIAQEYASNDKRVKVYSQPNGGACLARNHAISLASGELILPIDSDDKISPTYISNAAKVLMANPDVKVVIPRAEYFGDRVGEWKLKRYSLNLLARKNMIPACAMYRKSDWLRVGGYDPEFKTREDWAFWIAVLKDGGKVVYLPDVEFFYRIRPTSKRVTNRHFKSDVIDTLNRLHPEFFERELGGPLRHRRSWSKLINFCYRAFHPRTTHLSAQYAHLDYWLKSLPVRWNNGEGQVIHNRRNELRHMSFCGIDMVVKSFAVPNLLNRLVYGFLRKSKAQRSFEYAERLNSLGIKSPTPIAYYTERSGLLFSRSYYISQKSSCRHTFYDVIDNPSLANRDTYLRCVGRMTAKMHDAGIYPLDYSGGNILLDMVDGEPQFELVDLNRMAFCNVDIHKGCRGFERLNVEPEALAVMAREYARERHFDEQLCVELLQKYRWSKHQK
jgi:glycosyltransferase involved in cell wall biosynthesis